MRRIPRARYIDAVKAIKHDSDTTRMPNIAKALVSNKTSELFSEASKIKGCNIILICIIVYNMIEMRLLILNI